MESRKIIQFGKSSYIVSLPKEWIKKNGLLKGDTVYINDLENGELVLTNNNLKKLEPSEYSIDLPEKSEFDEKIKREIFYAYINNYKVIKLAGAGVKDNSLKIRDFLQNLAGLEILKQTSNAIVAHDLLDVTDLSLSQMVRRVDIICRSMMKDTIECVGQDKVDYHNIYKRDEDVNRLVYLATKMIKRAMSDPVYARKMKVTASDLVDYKFFLHNIERIADQCKRICRDLYKSKLNAKDKKIIKDLYSSVESDYLKVMKSYYNNNRNLAHEILNNSVMFLKKCDDSLIKVSSYKSIPIVEKLRTSHICVRHVGRVILKVF